MKLLLITDQHFGVRNDSPAYIEQYRRFYEKTVLPYIDKNKITHIVNLGDTFDKRKSINYSSLDAAKDMWFDPIRDRGIHMWMIIGNHDIYYKNTLKVNSPELILEDYDNITIVDEPQDINIGGLDILMLPWRCDANTDKWKQSIEDSKSTVCLGHLELSQFDPIPGYTMDHGDDPTQFEKFDLVCSGHYHHKSTKGNTNYLGNPYQLYWNDFGTERGFHTLNTKTKKLTFIKNPNNMFNKIYYRDSETAPIDYQSLNGTYVKLIVEKKEDQKLFDSKLAMILLSNPADLKIIEDTFMVLDEIDETVETEDTLSILNKCVAEVDHKDEVFGILKSLYVEAQRV
jgi:DNA repair exonuclease SbcCD nuclease subunit